jgi:polysaccharide pyruvyl transferase WcaK-like protein
MAREFLILGYFGAGNLGDDLMLRGVVRLLSEIAPDSVIHVVSYYRRDLPVCASDRIRIVRARTLSQKLYKLVPLMARRPIVLFGGGTPFTDTEGDGSYKFFRMASLLGCSFGYLGVGIGRLTLPRRRNRAQWLLRRCTAAVFRDPESMRRALDLTRGVHTGKFLCGEDLAYLDVANWPPVRRRDDAQYDVVLSWRELSGEEGPRRQEQLLHALCASMVKLRQTRRFARLTLLVLDPDVDLPVHRLLEQELSRVLPGVEIGLATTSHTDDILGVIAQAGLLVCVRLHGAFVGKTLGVPTVAFEYSPKLRYYFDSIGSSSLLRWDELLENSQCLVRAVGIALAESSSLPDAKRAARAAKQGVVDFLGAFA